MPTHLDLLRSVFGYSAFRGPQADIIKHVASGGDALVLMPTGGGKSLCYQIPALMRPDEVGAQIPSLKVPEDGSYDTVGGYVMAVLGRVAEVGDRVEAEGGTLEVERMDGRRVDRVKFIPAEPAAGTPSAGSPAEASRTARGARTQEEAR